MQQRAQTKSRKKTSRLRRFLQACFYNVKLTLAHHHFGCCKLPGTDAVQQSAQTTNKFNIKFLPNISPLIRETLCLGILLMYCILWPIYVNMCQSNGDLAKSEFRRFLQVCFYDVNVLRPIDCHFRRSQLQGTDAVQQSAQTTNKFNIKVGQIFASPLICVCGFS